VRLKILMILVGFCAIGLTLFHFISIQKPNQARLVFNMDDGYGFQLYKINLDGSGLQYLTNTLGDMQSRNVWGATCSSDGRYIIFYTNGLYRINSEGDDLTFIDRRGIITDLDWSREGNRIAFTGMLFSDNDTMGEIYTQNVDGSDLRRVTHNAYTDNFPAWSPNGLQIVFQYVENDASGLAIINADGTNLVRLTDAAENQGYYSAPSWSPDGQWIAYTLGREDHQHIYKMHPDGSNVIQLTKGTDMHFRPIWSRDGNLISYTLDRDGNREIYVMNSDGSNQQQVTNMQGNAFSVCWLPNT